MGNENSESKEQIFDGDNSRDKPSEDQQAQEHRGTIPSLHKSKYGPSQNLHDDFSNQVGVNGIKLAKIPFKKYKESPYCFIGAITGRTIHNKLTKGSGALISSNLVITAAHVVIDRKQSRNGYKQLQFHLGIYGKMTLKEGINVQTWWCPEEYRDKCTKNPNSFDYALLKLVDKVPRPFYLKPTISCHECLLDKASKKYLSISGYPCKNQLPNYTPIDQMQTIFEIYQYGLKERGAIVKIDQSNLVFYSITTQEGQSGCPIIFGDSFIGIHTGGSEKLQLNRGRLFDEMMFKRIQLWMKDSKSNSFTLEDKQTCPHWQKNKPVKYRNQIYIGRKGLTVLSLDQYLSIDKLIIDKNFLKAIDLSKNAQIKYLSIKGNQIASIDLSKNTQISILNLQGNNLTSIDLSKNSEITQLYLQNNKLTSLDLKKNTQIRKLALEHNKINSIDISKCTRITHLLMQYNYQLKSINLSNNTQIRTLCLPHCSLASIDISNSPQITGLQLFQNYISSIDISKNTQLTGLRMGNNKLTSIDISRNTLLTQLWLSQNQLASIDLSNNKEIVMLWLQNNQLTSIDLSKNAQIKDLWLTGNRITSIDLLGNNKAKPLLNNNCLVKVSFVYNNNMR